MKKYWIQGYFTPKPMIYIVARLKLLWLNINGYYGMNGYKIIKAL